RLGLAWQFTKNTVFRTGYGIFFGKTSNSTYYALRVENGVSQQTFTGCDPNTGQIASCAPTFPNVFFTPHAPAPAAPFPAALAPTVRSEERRVGKECQPQSGRFADRNEAIEDYADAERDV